MERVLEFKVLPAFAPLFHDSRPYVFLSGGRGSGKTTQSACFIITKLFEDTYNRIVISRYTQKSIKSSIYRDVLDLLEKFGLLPFVEITGDEIRNKMNGNLIFTHAFRMADGNMVAKSKGLASCNIFLLDEAQEIPDFDEYRKVIDTFRMKGVERKIIVVFNPPSKRHWLFKKFYIGSVHSPNPTLIHNHLFIHTTFKDNLQNLDPSKVEEWRRLEFDDPTYYKHQIEGEFTEGSEGAVYLDFQIGRPHPLGEYEVTYGLDFGFASDPTALVKVSRHNNELYLRELVYDTGLTMPDLAKRLTLLGLTKKDTIVADSSDPRSIEELKRLGFNVLPAYKGPDSVNSGIAKIKSFSTFMDPDSLNLHTEVDLYSWNKDTDKPIDKWNHALDAVRYALSHNKPSGKYAAIGASSNTFKDFEDKSHKIPARRKY